VALVLLVQTQMEIWVVTVVQECKFQLPVLLFFMVVVEAAVLVELLPTRHLAEVVAEEMGEVVELQDLLVWQTLAVVAAALEVMRQMARRLLKVAPVAAAS
jgi:hypothetical protein